MPPPKLPTKHIRLPLQFRERENADRALDYLMRTLEAHRGITQVDVDLEHATLALTYDPRVFGLEQVRKMAQRIGIEFARKFRRGSFRLGGMGLRSFAQALERHLLDEDAITSVTVNPGSSRVTVEYEDGRTDLGRIEQRVAELGYPVRPEERLEPWLKRYLELALALACGGFALLGFALGQLGAAPAWSTISFVLAYIAGAWEAAPESYHSLRRGTVDIHTLMLAAAAGAAGLGHWGEGSTLLFLFALSGALEQLALQRTSRALSDLVALKPSDAWRVENGEELAVLAETLQIGDRIRIKPGERVPADGQIVEGHSALDLSALTGESTPVEVVPGGEVFAGALNHHGALLVRVTKQASDNTLARIIELVQQAQAGRAPTQRIIDRFGSVYAATVLSLTLLAVLVPWLLGLGDLRAIVYRAMTLLVVASPCALVISTPASILSAIANGARRGILFKGGVYLETAATVRAIAFDKTGTLTRGRIRVTDVVPAEGIERDELLRLTGGAERNSEHPMARAVAEAAKRRGLELPEPQDFMALPGRGLRARVDGRAVLVGNQLLLREHGRTLPAALEQRHRELTSAGNSVVAVADDRVLGLIAFADEIRPEARAVLQALRELGVEHTVMLTGDQPEIARAVAEQVGVDEWHAGLLPEHKVERLRELRQRYGRVGMVGDGVNDAPALTASDLGVAMGVAGADVSLETADLVLMSDHLEQLVTALRLSRRARRTVIQNLALSVAIISVLIAGALLGAVNLPLGVVGHEGNTLLVVANGLRLLRGD
ncbi:MAG TPA: cation-translocating P-type ATPase [Acidobacteriota bacterium]